MVVLRAARTRCPRALALTAPEPRARRRLRAGGTADHRRAVDERRIARDPTCRFCDGRERVRGRQTLRRPRSDRDSHARSRPRGASCRFHRRPSTSRFAVNQAARCPLTLRPCDRRTRCAVAEDGRSSARRRATVGTCDRRRGRVGGCVQVLAGLGADIRQGPARRRSARARRPRTMRRPDRHGRTRTNVPHG